MNKILFVTGLILLFICTVRAEYVPDEILIKFKPAITYSITAEVSIEKILEVSASKVSQLSNRCNVKIPEVKGILKQIGVLHLKFPSGTDITKIIEKYGSDPDVEYAEPNYIRHIFTPPPNDPAYNNAGGMNQWGLIKIMANYAWDVTKGNTSVIVAVLDTGVDTDHPDLFTNLSLPGQDVVNGDSDPDDDHGHGTHVAGIIGAVTDNLLGVAGVSWYSKILPVKVLSAGGSGSDDQVALGIDWAVSRGAKVLNLSLGGRDYSNTLKNAVDNARAQGSVVVAAAGNTNSNIPEYPAGYTGVIAVGATDQNDQRSIWGSGWASNYGDWIVVVAPGSSIWSTYMGGGYASLNGTSMAAPFVSGVAALIFSRFPTITRAEVEDRIKRGVDDLGSSGKDSTYGYGRINALKSVGDFLAEVDPIKIYVYPNPARFPENLKIIIKNVPLATDFYCRIYTIAGELVREFKGNEIIFRLDPDWACIEWNGNNMYSEKVASGVYIAVVSDGKKIAFEKIMVIR